MYCHHCGNKLDSGFKFCPHCSTPVLQEVQPVSLDQAPKHGKSRKKKPLIFLIPLAVVLLSLSILYFIKQNVRASDNYFNTYNMSNGDYVARNHDYIFYKDTSGAIIRMDADHQNRMIITDTSMGHLYLSGDHLYYLTENRCIVSTDLNGEDLRQIIPNNTRWFAIVDEYIYFIDGYTIHNGSTAEHIGPMDLCRATLDGSSIEILIPGYVYGISIQNGSIVYMDVEGNLFVAEPDGTESKFLFNRVREEMVNYLIYQGKCYYYSYASDDQEGIYCLDLNTGERKKIVSAYNYYFTFWNNSLIYFGEDPDGFGATCICDLDGNNIRRLLDDPLVAPLVMGDYLYYYTDNYSDSQDILSLNLKTLEVQQVNPKVADSRYEDLSFTDQYIYYIDGHDENVYRCDYSGNNVIKLTDNSCDALYTYKNDIYYYGYSNSTYTSGDRPIGLFRLDEYLENCSAVELNGSASCLFNDDYIYFASNMDSHLYRTGITNVDTEEYNTPYIWEATFETPSRLHFIRDNWIYMHMYLDDDQKLVRQNLNNASIQILVDDHPSYRVQLYNETIYYLKKNESGVMQLRSVNLDGTGDRVILSENMSEYVIEDGIVFFIDPILHNLYRINLDGTGKTKLSSSVCSDILLNNGILYFANLSDNGHIYTMNLDGSNVLLLIGDNSQYTEKTDYKTEGVDNTSSDERFQHKKISYSPTDILTFEDPKFEEFLCVMFGKNRGTITGQDLLSIEYWGYFEGSPTEAAYLMNYRDKEDLYWNSVLVSTELLPDHLDFRDVLCLTAGEEGLDYRRRCTVVIVQSNEWMAEHVFPYLYYFKNVDCFAFAYCWMGEKMCLPEGSSWTSLNCHARYFETPYDPEYY